MVSQHSQGNATVPSRAPAVAHGTLAWEKRAPVPILGQQPSRTKAPKPCPDHYYVILLLRSLGDVIPCRLFLLSACSLLLCSCTGLSCRMKRRPRMWSMSHSARG